MNDIEQLLMSSVPYIPAFLKPGDIFCIEGHWYWKNGLTYAFDPPAKFFHCGLIETEAIYSQDYFTLESISDFPFGGLGVRTQPLSHYKGKHATIFRHAKHPEAGNLACERFRMEHSRAFYDVKLYVLSWLSLPALALKMAKERRRLKPEDLWYPGQDHSFICTELVVMAWQLAGFPILPRNVMPTPNAIQDAANKGLLTLVFDGIL
jgi:hypothetical protein